MKITRFALMAVLWIGLLEATLAAADTHYVALGGQTPASPYTNWTTAASNIQDAIDAAVANDTVLVSNGVYATGMTGGIYGTNRVAVGGRILRSVNGPAVTIIKGQFHSGEPGAAGTITNGWAAVRCVYIESGTLIGFTMTNGATGTDSSWGNLRGGGVYNRIAGTATISNCVITGNSASSYGAGAEVGTLYNCLLIGNLGGASCAGGGANNSIMYNCTLTGNSGPARGGGAYGCTLYNCLLTGNLSPWGGGADSCNIYNCTIVSNTATSTGGGVLCSVVCNSIVYFNIGCASSNWHNNGASLTFTNCCTAPVPVAAGQGGWTGGTMSWTNLVTNNPEVVNSAGGNYRLLKTSPCINTATNFSWMSNGKDLDGYRRLDRFSSLPDMGCYEYVPQGTIYCFH